MASLLTVSHHSAPFVKALTETSPQLNGQLGWIKKEDFARHASVIFSKDEKSKGETSTPRDEDERLTSYRCRQSKPNRLERPSPTRSAGSPISSVSSSSGRAGLERRAEAYIMDSDIGVLGAVEGGHPEQVQRLDRAEEVAGV